MSRWAMLGLWFVAQLAHIFASLRMVGFIIGGSERGVRVLLAYDRLGNVAAGGEDDETISSRANRERLAGSRGWCLLCRVLHLFDRNHCEKSAGV